MILPRKLVSSCLYVSSAALVGCGARADGAGHLSAQDSSAIQSVQAAYVKAWLADDTSAVLATMDSAAMLLPPGHQPVRGHDAIRAYWWPNDGSHTVIKAFDLSVEELVGSKQLAFTRGVSTVSWRYEKDTVRSEQTSRTTSLTILARGEDGRWRIIRQMWGPPLKS